MPAQCLASLLQGNGSKLAIAEEGHAHLRERREMRLHLLH